MAVSRLSLTQRLSYTAAFREVVYVVAYCSPGGLPDMRGGHRQHPGVHVVAVAGLVPALRELLSRLDAAENAR
jgi:hypothetical protein